MTKDWLAHPLMRNLPLDSEVYFDAQLEVLRRKSFLKKVYQDLYIEMTSWLPKVDGFIFELGSGAGFIEKILPEVIKTDVIFHSGLHIIMDAICPPLMDSSLSALLFLDVFHHIPDADRFLQQANRILKVGGRIIMVEPWVSDWSKKVYPLLHREPLDYQAQEWRFASSGAVSSANQALPWIVFQRDRSLFERKFPQFHLMKIQPMLPFRYLLSGGFSSRFGFPSFLYSTVKAFENLFEKHINDWAMFALIVLEKVR